MVTRCIARREEGVDGLVKPGHDEARAGGYA
jgi:hypothetical protein